MTYFYNSSTGGFANESPPAPQYFTYEAQLHLGQGWHAYGTLAAMDAAITANGWPPADASKGLLSGTSTVPSTGPRAANAAKNAATSAAQDIWHGLLTQNLLMRVGEILAGLILLGIGVNAMFHGRPMQVVTGTAGLAAKIVP